MSRVATEGMLPPFMAAAAFCVVLAGATVAWKTRQQSSDSYSSNKVVGKSSFDSFSRGGDTAVTEDEFASSVGPLSMKRSWDLHVQEESHNQPNLAPISEEPIDPDLAHLSGFFDVPDSPTRSHVSEEQSQFSIEDFVNEAERSLLGVRIRYPGHARSSNDSVADSDQEEGEQEMSTALVPAPPSAILPFSNAVPYKDSEDQP